jgi:D-alanyl-D-alanine carboxypeptidase (penicillin-binding protein 5/6)
MLPEVISGKTGFTSKAGYCYVAAMESEGRKYTIALLACGWPNNRTYKWSDAKLLFSYGKAYFRKEEIVFPKTAAKLLVVNGKKRGATLKDWGEPVYITAECRSDTTGISCLLSETEQYAYETVLPDKIYHAVKSGDMVGKTQCYLEEELMTECKILAAEDCELWDFSALLQCVFEVYFLRK